MAFGSKTELLRAIFLPFLYIECLISIADGSFYDIYYDHDSIITIIIVE